MWLLFIKIILAFMKCRGGSMRMSAETTDIQQLSTEAFPHRVGDVGSGCWLVQLLWLVGWLLDKTIEERAVINSFSGSYTNRQSVVAVGWDRRDGENKICRHWVAKILFVYIKLETFNTFSCQAESGQLCINISIGQAGRQRCGSHKCVRDVHSHGTLWV